MPKLKTHVKRHAKRIVKVGKAVHKKMNQPMHPYISWWAVSISALSAFLIINGSAAGLVYGDEGRNFPPMFMQQQMLNSSGTPRNREAFEGSCKATSSTPCQMPPKAFKEFMVGGDEGFKKSTGTPAMVQKPEIILKELNKASEQVNRLQKSGAEVPVEVLSALSKLKNLVDTAKDSKSQVPADELNNLISILRDGLNNLNQAGQLPKVFADANNQINKIKKALEIDKKKALNANLDISNEQNKLENSIKELEKVLLQFKSNAQQSPQTAFEKLRTDFYSRLDNLWSMEMQLQLLLNPKSFSSLVSKDLKQAYKKESELKKQNVDVSDLENLLSEAQNKLNNLRDLLKIDNFDREGVTSLGKELISIKQKIFDQLESLGKKYNFEPPQIKNQPQLFQSKDFKPEE